MDWTTLVERFQSEPHLQALSTAAVALTLALLASQLTGKVLPRLTQLTQGDLDDRIVEQARHPIALTIALVGLWHAIRLLELPEGFLFVTYGLLMTSVVLSWTVALSRIVSLLLAWVETHQGKHKLVQTRTMPVFEILGKTLVLGSAAYFFFLAWNVDLTAWMASAGVVGIAVGFAAKDTLANLFAGIFIIADAPYKMGDYLILDNGARGRVTEIGIRATRILTRDDVEIIVPNAVMANAMIINESGGPYEKERLKLVVGVAYGSDIDRVREILLEIAGEAEQISASPTPRVRFREMGDSALVFHLMVWIDRPELRGKVSDALNTEIYKRLTAEGIEIPYPKRDVYLHHVGERPADD